METRINVLAFSFAILLAALIAYAPTPELKEGRAAQTDSTVSSSTRGISEANKNGDWQKTWEKAWVEQDKIQGLSQKAKHIAPKSIPDGDTYFTRNPGSLGGWAINNPKLVKRFAMAHLTNDYEHRKQILLSIAEDSSIASFIQARAYTALSHSAFRSRIPAHKPERRIYAEMAYTMLPPDAPQQSDALYLLAHCAIEEGDLRKAVSLLSEAVKLDELFLWAHNELVLSASQLLSRQRSEAPCRKMTTTIALLKSIESIVELTTVPQDFLSLATRISRNAATLEARFATGYCLYQGGESAEAKVYFTSIIQSSRNDKIAQQLQQKSSQLLQRLKCPEEPS